MTLFVAFSETFLVLLIYLHLLAAFMSKGRPEPLLVIGRAYRFDMLCAGGSSCMNMTS